MFILKINIEFENDNAFVDLIDSLFVSHLKHFRKDVQEYTKTSWNEEDKIANEKLLEACDTILEHFGENDG